MAVPLFVLAARQYADFVFKSWLSDSTPLAFSLLAADFWLARFDAAEPLDLERDFDDYWAASAEVYFFVAVAAATVEEEDDDGFASWAEETAALSGSAASWTAANCLTEAQTPDEPRLLLPVDALRIGDGLN